MAFVIADRVRETTTTIGTGSVTLGGAYTSFQTFSAAIGNGNNTYYTIASAATGEWEVGIGTYSSGPNSLSRDTVLASSAGGAAVSFSVGSKDVFVTQPSERSLLLNSSSNGLVAGNAAFTAGDLLYATSTTAVSNLAVGALNTVLTSTGSVPQWSSGLNISTLTTSSTVTLNGGTANGVAYLNASKVLTTGSALTFDGSTLATTGALTVGGNTTLGDASTDTVTVNGYMGVGGAGQSNVALNVANAALTGANQYGVSSQPTGSSSATTQINAYDAYPQVANAAFTVADVRGVNVRAGLKGASATATNWHGLYVADQTQGTNNYGITSLVSSGTNKWNIYASGTAANYFAGNVGIGTSSPGAKLNVQSTGIQGLFQYDASNQILVFHSGSNGYFGTYTNQPLILRTNNTDRATINASGNLGLGVTPSAWGSNYKALDIGGNVGIAGYSNSMYQLANAYAENAAYKYKASTFASMYLQTSGQHIFYTAPSGTAGNAISFTQALTLDANQNLLLNGTSAGASSVGTFAIFNGTAPTGSVTNGIILYAEDVSSSSELKVRDEAGNVTTLSPHNFSLIPNGPSEDMAWAYYSEKGGKRINVDMLKLARMVEKLTGEKLVYES